MIETGENNQFRFPIGRILADKLLTLDRIAANRRTNSRRRLPSSIDDYFFCFPLFRYRLDVPKLSCGVVGSGVWDDRIKTTDQPSQARITRTPCLSNGARASFEAPEFVMMVWISLTGQMNAGLTLPNLLASVTTITCLECLSIFR